MLSDQPVQKAEDDKLNRAGFALALSNALILSPGSASLVVGIEGAWGTGKTSVLNMVQESLERHELEPIVIRLESWLLSGTNGGVGTFLAQIASKLGQSNPSGTIATTAKTLIELTKFLSPAKLIPGVEPWASMLENVLKNVGQGAEAAAGFAQMDFQKKKAEVSKGLQESGLPIVVILDDLDRLEPEEIRQIFRLVKAVADFERVAYLLAYDPAPVQRALAFDGTYDGGAFLEKIVQVAYQIPNPGYFSLKRLLMHRLDELLESSAPTTYERKRLEKFLSGGLAQAIRHGRDVVRLINRLRISLPPTRGEVNLADVVAFELLAVRFPAAAEAIRQRPYDFIGGYFHHPEPFDTDYYDHWESREKDKSEIPQWRKRLLENLSEPDQRILQALLSSLFPGFLGHPLDMNSLSESPTESELRICYRDPLLKLLSVGPVEGIFSVRDVRRFMEEPNERENLLNELAIAGSLGQWLSFSSMFLPRGVPLPMPENLLQLLSHLAEGMNIKTEAANSRSELQGIASFILDLLSHLSPDLQKKLLAQIAENQLSISLSEEIIAPITRQHGLWGGNEMPGNKFIEDKEIVLDTVKLWLNAVRVAKEKRDRFISEVALLGILFRWGQLSGDFREAQSFVEELCQTEQGIDRFASLWPPRSSLEGFHLLANPKSFIECYRGHWGRAGPREELIEGLEQLEKSGAGSDEG